MCLVACLNSRCDRHGCVFHTRNATYALPCPSSTNTGRNKKTNLRPPRTHPPIQWIVEPFDQGEHRAFAVSALTHL